MAEEEEDEKAAFARVILAQFKSLSGELEDLEGSLRALDEQLSGIQARHDGVLDEIEAAAYPVPTRRSAPAPILATG